MCSCTWLIPVEFNPAHAGFACLLFFVVFNRSTIKSVTVCDLIISADPPDFLNDLLVVISEHCSLKDM